MIKVDIVNEVSKIADITKGTPVTTRTNFRLASVTKQFAAAGMSWRVYVQNYPGNCFDGDSFFGGIDGPGVSGQYVRKHNPVISFESARLNPAECANIQPLARNVVQANKNSEDQWQS